MEIPSCHLKTRGVHILRTRSFLQKPRKVHVIICSTSGNSFTSHDQSTNLYKVLSLDSEVGFDEIKKAYLSMARQYHPDVVPDSRKEDSTRKFIELQTAYETLSNPIERQKYDNELRQGNVTSTRDDKSFHKDVWEDQLEGLKERSHARRSKRGHA